MVRRNKGKGPRLIKSFFKLLATGFLILWAPLLAVTLALGPFAFIGWLATKVFS